jgi:hypothetical protein
MNLIETLMLIRTNEKKIENSLRDGLISKRNQKIRLDTHILDRLDAISLPAVNSDARIKWARIFAREMFAYFGMPPNDSHPDESVFLVTLADKEFITTAKRQDIEIPLMKRTFGGRLKGLNYIGVIEPGYYNNVYINGEDRKELVSWHMHALVWGVAQRRVVQIVKRLNDKSEAIMPQCKAAHQKIIGHGEFGRYLWYVNKSPYKEYSVGKRRKRHKKTGAARFKTNKRDIRPGNQVKLFHLLKPLYLDQLAMAGGEGKAILGRVKNQALRKFREKYGWSERRY